MTNETKILTALLDPNGTDHYLMHTTVGRNITIRHDGVTNAIIIEHGDKRIMVAMGKEDSLDGLIPLMRMKKGVREFDTYREPLTPTKSGEDGKGIPSVFSFNIMERMTPLEKHIADNLDIPDVAGGFVMRSVGSHDEPHTTVADHPFMKLDPVFGGEYHPTDTLDCGCIDRDQAKVACESCHRISCLDCHEIDSTPVKVADWKCKEGFGCSMEEEE